MRGVAVAVRYERDDVGVHDMPDLDVTGAQTRLGAVPDADVEVVPDLADVESGDGFDLVCAFEVLEHIEAGMNIFIGTGAGEPRTMVKHLMRSDTLKNHDLTLIQMVSFGDTVNGGKATQQRKEIR